MATILKHLQKIFYQGEKPPETATTFTKSWPRKSYFLGVQVKVSQHTSRKRYACTSETFIFKEITVRNDYLTFSCNVSP